MIVGTPLPTADFAVYGANASQQFLEEKAGSPRVERAEQCTCEHTLDMDKSTAIRYFDNLPRGTIVSDTQGNIWRVLSCDYTRDNDLHVQFHYVMESLSFDSPPDDFEINDVSLDLFIIKHPRYWRWLCPYADDAASLPLGDTAVSSIQQIKEALIRICQNYIESPFYPSQNMTQNYIQANIINSLNDGTFQIPVTNPTFKPGSPNVAPVAWDGNAASIPGLGNPNCPYYLVPVTYAWQNDDPDVGPIHMAIAATTELISKLWRQEDTPLIPAYDIVWTQRFFQTVYLNPGSYNEDPRDVVPSYFMGEPQDDFQNIGLIPRGYQGVVDVVAAGGNLDTVPAAGAGNGSILDTLVEINPQLFSSDGTSDGNLVISSIRTSDSFHYERTWFAVTHKWKVACVGKWDRDLYLGYGESAPQQVSDFNKNPVSAGTI